MAFLNSVLFWIPLLNIIKNFFIAAVIIIFLFLAQYLLYMWFAKGKDRDYTKK
jgi:hypothetical protein